MQKIKVSNFRKIKESWDLDLAPITFFTGTNNSGKSTVIKSLLLLEDYVKSNNHLELNFHGENFYKHKIESFKSAINRVNFKNFQKDIHLEYQNNGFEISILFQPSEHYHNGTLKKLKMVRSDKATLEIDLVSLNNYQLKVDALLLNQNDKENIEDKKDKLKTLALLQTTSNLIDFDKKELKELEKEIEKYTDEIQLIDKSNFNLENIKKENSDVFINKYKNLISENRKKIFELNQTIADTEKKLKILQKKRNEIVHQKKDHLTYSPTFSVEDFDISNRRIDIIIRTILPKYLVENNLGNRRKKNDFKNSDESLELDKANKLGDELLVALSFNVKHLSPHRSNQNKLFLHENKDVDINYLVKNHFEKQLHSDLTVLEFMKKWMSKDYFDIGDDYRITTYESTVSKIEVFEDESWINLSDKGFGAGQVFTVLLAIASSIIENQRKIAEKGALFQEDLSIILIEEPEANLHPGLQSKLAELFLEASYKFGISFILETHSEYMIRKSQLLNLDDKVFKLYYFSQAGPYEMEYTDKGGFSRGFGKDFYDVSDDLALQIVLKSNS
jgi:predicted ATPase